MKILFINPPIEYELKFPGPNKTWGQHEFAPPLGLMSLSAFLKREGYNSIELINGQTPRGTSDGEILKKIQEFSPNLVGITVNSILHYNAMRIANLIKDYAQSTKIVIGGPHLTIYPVESVAQPYIDFGVVGEGEYTLIELIKALEGDNDFSAVAGLVWKKDGEVVVNPARKFSKSLDELPMPDHSLFDLKQHRIPFDEVSPTGVIISSRGCPYKCRFCSQNYPYYRMRSAEIVVEEMFHYRDMGYKAVTFYDDIFNVSNQRILRICSLLKERGFDLPWSFRGRIDCFNESQAKAASEAGCYRIYFGVESGCNDTLEKMNKKITVEQSRQAFSLTKKYGIATVAYFIVGFPGESIEQAKKTVRFAFELNPDYVVFQTLVPAPGSEIYDQAVAEGAFPDYGREAAMNPKPNLEMRTWETTMTEKEMFSIMRGALLRFYFRPSYIFKSLRRVGGLEDILVKGRMGIQLFGRLIKSVGDKSL